MFGLLAIGGRFAGLYKLKWYALIWFGVFNILLVGLNNLLYYNEPWRYFLPFVQKIAFFFSFGPALFPRHCSKEATIKKTGNHFLLPV